jgi:hypothetical protein
MYDTRIRRLTDEELQREMQSSNQGKDGNTDNHEDVTSLTMAYTLLLLLPMIIKAFVWRG